MIAALLGLDGGAPYGQLESDAAARSERGPCEALVEQLLGLAAQEPVLVVLEDAHWIDPTTLEMIEQCLGQIAEARVSDPAHQPAGRAARASAGRPHVTRLTINRLGHVAVEAIVSARMPATSRCLQS